jgi:bifunctional DNase/RNase
VHVAVLSGNLIANENWYCEAHAKDFIYRTLGEKRIGEKLASPVLQGVIAEISVIASWPAEQKNYIHFQEQGSRRSFGLYCGPIEVSVLHATLRSDRLPRPLTHDLVIEILGRLDGEVGHVFITACADAPEGAFSAFINIFTKTNTYQIDARPTDAIAIASLSAAPLLLMRPYEAGMKAGTEKITLRSNDCRKPCHRTFQGRRSRLRAFTFSRPPLATCFLHATHSACVPACVRPQSVRFARDVCTEADASIPAASIYAIHLSQQGLSFCYGRKLFN